MNIYYYITINYIIYYIIIILSIYYIFIIYRWSNIMFKALFRNIEYA